MIRLLFTALVIAALAGCSALHLGGNSSGVSVVGKSDYCGTASQDSEVHYFANADDFADWIDYRNITDLSPKMARHGGVVVVEMGQRPTGGYSVKLDNRKTGIKNGMLKISMDWHAPRLDAAVSQALTTECVALRIPAGNYRAVEVLDQLGNERGRADVNRAGGS